MMACKTLLPFMTETATKKSLVVRVTYRLEVTFEVTGRGNLGACRAADNVCTTDDRRLPVTDPRRAHSPVRHHSCISLSCS